MIKRWSVSIPWDGSITINWAVIRFLYWIIINTCRSGDCRSPSGHLAQKEWKWSDCFSIFSGLKCDCLNEFICFMRSDLNSFSPSFLSTRVERDLWFKRRNDPIAHLANGEAIWDFPRGNDGGCRRQIIIHVPSAEKREEALQACKLQRLVGNEEEEGHWADTHVELDPWGGHTHTHTVGVSVSRPECVCGEDTCVYYLSPSYKRATSGRRANNLFPGSGES